MNVETVYTIYLLISVVMTVGVGWTLHRHGRQFLIDSFKGNTVLADSLNHLLLVGFYLLNLGFVLLWLKIGDKPRDMSGAIETLSMQIGVVLVVLGIFHMFNLGVLALARKASLGNGRTSVAAIPTSY
jgi:hypothetical protein